jgi:hypothetical protein
MSSSYSLQKRLKEKKYVFPARLGDTYIKPWGKCHPAFESVPLDTKNPETGVQMCVRKNADVATDPIRPERRIVNYSKPLERRTNTRPGEGRQGIDVYSTKMPNQDYLHAAGYLRWEFDFDAIGIPNSLHKAQGRNGYFTRM